MKRKTFTHLRPHKAFAKLMLVEQQGWSWRTWCFAQNIWRHNNREGFVIMDELWQEEDAGVMESSMVFTPHSPDPLNNLQRTEQLWWVGLQKPCGLCSNPLKSFKKWHDSSGTLTKVVLQPKWNQENIHLIFFFCDFSGSAANHDTSSLLSSSIIMLLYPQSCCQLAQQPEWNKKTDLREVATA